MTTQQTSIVDNLKNAVGVVVDKFDALKNNFSSEHQEELKTKLMSRIDTFAATAEHEYENIVTGVKGILAKWEGEVHALIGSAETTATTDVAAAKEEATTVEQAAAADAVKAEDQVKTDVADVKEQVQTDVASAEEKVQGDVADVETKASGLADALSEHLSQPADTQAQAN